MFLRSNRTNSSASGFLEEEDDDNDDDFLLGRIAEMEVMLQV